MTTEPDGALAVSRMEQAQVGSWPPPPGSCCTGGSTAARIQAPADSGVLGDLESFALILSAPAQVVILMMGLLGAFAFGHEYGTAPSCPC